MQPSTNTRIISNKDNHRGRRALGHRPTSNIRRLVGKLQWLAYTRPDMAYSIKELARSIQQPSIRDQKKLKHVIRYLAGTTTYKLSIRPTIKLTTHDLTPIDLNIYVDSDWAGCHQTLKSTSGFIIQFLGTTIHFGSRTQAVVTLSSAEEEFYGIGTGTQEGLYIRNFYWKHSAIERSTSR